MIRELLELKEQTDKYWYHPEKGPVHRRNFEKALKETFTRIDTEERHLHEIEEGRLCEVFDGEKPPEHTTPFWFSVSGERPISRKEFEGRTFILRYTPDLRMSQDVADAFGNSEEEREIREWIVGIVGRKLSYRESLKTRLVFKVYDIQGKPEPPGFRQGMYGERSVV